MRNWNDEIVRYQTTVQRILDATLQDLDLPPHMPPLPVDPKIPSSPVTVRPTRIAKNTSMQYAVPEEAQRPFFEKI